MIRSTVQKIPTCERQISLWTESYPRNSVGLPGAIATTARCCQSGDRGFPVGRSWPFPVTGGAAVSLVE